MNPKKYLLRVLVSIFVVFSLILSVACSVVQGTVLSAKYYENIIDKYKICDFATEQLEEDFEEASHTSGIDASVYMENITDELIENAVKNNITNAIEYCKGKRSSYEYGVAVDTTAISDGITEFFENYAKEIDYEKDDAYNEKLNETIEFTIETFNTDTDVMKFSEIAAAGVFDAINKYYPIIKIIMVACYVLTALFIALLVFISLKDKPIYWAGVGIFPAGVLLMVPCIIFKASGFLGSFVIKIKAIFYSVTGLISGMIDITLIVGIVLTGIGLVLMLTRLLSPKNKIN